MRLFRKRQLFLRRGNLLFRGRFFLRFLETCRRFSARFWRTCYVIASEPLLHGALEIRRHFDDRAATLVSATATRVVANVFAVVFVIKFELVVVHQFFANFDGFDGVNPDVSVFDDGFTIRIARMIQVFRIATCFARVKHGVVIEDEQECVMPSGRVIVVIPFVRFCMRDWFAEVFDEAFAFTDGTGSERATPLNRRAVNFKRLILF